MKVSCLLALRIAILLGVASIASAGTITVGTFDSINAAPFDVLIYSGEYQQLYVSSDFAGPVTINSLGFAEGSLSGSGETINVTISLSTTSATPSTLSTNYAANKGPDFTQVFSQTISYTSTGLGNFDLVFNISPFSYNPAEGNLLMDVVLHGGANTGPFLGGDFEATSDLTTTRIFNLAGFGAPTSSYGEAEAQGLVTQFGVTPTPEPSSLSIIVLGALALKGIFRRKLL